MRTIAALLLAVPLLASAEGASPEHTWVDEPVPPTPAAAEPAPAQPPPAQPAPAQPPPAPPAYPPPPQAAPPAALQPPPYAPAPISRPPRTRDRWYLGFGLGGGDGKVATGSSTYTFRQANGDRATDTGFFNLKVGATLSPTLLLGADLSGTASAAGSGGTASALAIANLDAVATWFPRERGFFLRGGAGISTISFSRKDASGKQDASKDGFNVVAGLGWAFWLGSQFNLTVDLDYSRQWYGGSSTLHVTDAEYWAAWVGFDWY